jgi:hypothetical protein
LSLTMKTRAGMQNSRSALDESQSRLRNPIGRKQLDVATAGLDAVKKEENLCSWRESSIPWIHWSSSTQPIHYIRSHPVSFYKTSRICNAARDKVVQIWPGQTVTCLHTNSPGHIWTTLYIRLTLLVMQRLQWLDTNLNTKFHLKPSSSFGKRKTWDVCGHDLPILCSFYSLSASNTITSVKSRPWKNRTRLTAFPTQMGYCRVAHNARASRTTTRHSTAYVMLWSESITNVNKLNKPFEMTEPCRTLHYTDIHNSLSAITDS